MYTIAFFVWLAAAVLMLFVFHYTRNWNNGSNLLSTSDTLSINAEQLLHHKIAKLQHECSEMAGVMILYNSDDVRNEYWDLKSQLQEAENELQHKYGRSRKVTQFTRI